MNGSTWPADGLRERLAVLRGWARGVRPARGAPAAVPEQETTPASAPGPAPSAAASPAGDGPGGRRGTGSPGAPPAPVSRGARIVPVPVVPRARWEARRTPPLLYARMSHSQRAAYRDRHPQCRLCRCRPTAAVDHDAVTGHVRGAVCRSCNSWLGSMEAALRVPARAMQQQAASCTGGSRPTARTRWPTTRASCRIWG